VKTHPLGQIAHPLQAFRPNGLIDYFSLFCGRRPLAVRAWSGFAILLKLHEL